MSAILSEAEIGILKEAHIASSNRKVADRIKAVLMYDRGRSAAQICEDLLLDETTIHRYIKKFKAQGIDGLLENLYMGGLSYLSPLDQQALKCHLESKTYLTSKEVTVYVKNQFKVDYTPEGMAKLLKRLGFVYKKMKAVPGKADPKIQEEFLEHEYWRIKREKGVEDKIYFLDGCHPVHNVQPSYGWIIKGRIKEIPTNTGRKRININGALDVENMELIFRTDETINAQSTIALFKQLEKKNPNAKQIYVISDNATYYRACLVKEYLKKSKIKLKFLPSYSPNLNLIERFWKFFKKKVLTQYYETFDEFKRASLKFLRNIKKYRTELDSLITENFQIIGKYR